jgi:hypothetical protein
MKGQFFVIAAIVIAVSLVMVKGMLGVYSASEASANENTKIDDRQIENIERNYEQISGIALLQSDANMSLGRYMSNFSGYIRDSEDSKILWIAVFSNGTDQSYSVTAGNYLQNDVTLSIAATDSVPSGMEMFIPDKSFSSAKFISTINGTINVTISYTLSGNSIEDTFHFPVSAKDSSTVYLDISLISGNSAIRAKDAYTSIKQ